MNQIKGILLGVFVGGGLFLAAFPVLFLNEKYTVENLAAIAKARDIVVTVEPDAIKPEHDGELIHFSGTEETKDVLTDPEFGVSANAVHLVREVKMYQWVEEEEDGEDNKEPTYRYRKDWLADYQDSNDFHESGHENPPMPYHRYEDTASEVNVGAFPLNDELIDQLRDNQAVTPSLDDVPEPMRSRLAVTSEGFYLPMSARGDSGATPPSTPSSPTPETPGTPDGGAGGDPVDGDPVDGDPVDGGDPSGTPAPDDNNTSLRGASSGQEFYTSLNQESDAAALPSTEPSADADAAADAGGADSPTGDDPTSKPAANPAVEAPTNAEIGDLKISFKKTPPGLKVSVISGQKGDHLEAFEVMQGGYYQNDLRMGEHTADQILDMQENESNMMTWVWRACGCLMMFFGLLLIMRPVTALADFVPILGGVVGGIAFLIAGLISVALSFITIAISWVVVRPLIGIPLLIVALLLLAGAIYLIVKSRKTPEAKPAGEM
ncbi:MAG: TMEM43 family protein [Pirellulaceae bacterium]